MDVQESESILFKKLHPGEEHHSASAGLIEFSELSNQCRDLWEERVDRLMKLSVVLCNPYLSLCMSFRTLQVVNATNGV